jgi:hypothetical protein
VNAESDRETDGCSAVDYLQLVIPWKLACQIRGLILLFGRAIARILNNDYCAQTYGLGGANTRYPISAFVTDLVYLEGTQIAVDVKKITVSGAYIN